MRHHAAPAALFRIAFCRLSCIFPVQSLDSQGSRDTGNLEITLRNLSRLWGSNDTRLGKSALCDPGTGAIHNHQAAFDQCLPETPELTSRGPVAERSPGSVRSGHEVPAR